MKLIYTNKTGRRKVYIVNKQNEYYELLLVDEEGGVLVANVTIRKDEKPCVFDFYPLRHYTYGNHDIYKYNLDEAIKKIQEEL